MIRDRMTYSSLAIANEFLCRGNDSRIALTHMQVQKLVYLTHGWRLGSGYGALIDERFEAWAFGPVSRKLYDSLKRYGARPVTALIAWGDDTPFNGEGELGPAHEQIDDNTRLLIDRVFDTYADHDGFQLSALTHEEGTPWQQTYVRGQNKTIPNKLIARYFGALVLESEAA